MDVNGAEVLLNILTNMGEDLLFVKAHEALGLQTRIFMLSHLSAFDTILNNVYEISCPSLEDYANRRDLVRIFNEIAKEMYGNNDGCPVVEDFGSCVMDMFSARSDLDLSINFSDKLFEADRMAKIKTLRKFAKKFYALRKKGHVTNVELILSARVPVLKVTDSGSGIDCDFSVGNRDGVAKSQIVLMISAIDERFKKLSMMIKAWAKAHDINSSKDGTLNSLSLILLVAFHLQTRDIPILPPFSAIFKDGMDPVAVNLIPSFLNYGQRNTESLAELFVSLLIKLESVRKLWSKGLCASTYEGSWIHKDWKASGCIRIEDFSDRSQNTARAVKSAQFKKIYTCIWHSLEHIKSFTEGKTDAGKLTNLLFGVVHPQGEKVHAIVNNSEPSKPISPNPARKKAKSSAQVGPERQIRKLSEVKSPVATRKKKKRSGQVGPEGQRPGKQVKLNPCSSKAAPTSCKSDTVKKKKKSRSGMKIDPQTSDNLTSFRTLIKQPETLSGNRFPLNPPIQGLGGVTPTGTINSATPTFQVAQSYDNRPAQSFGESIRHRASVENLNGAPLSFPIRQYSPPQPVEQYGGYRPQRTHADSSSHGAPNFPSQLLAYPNQHFQNSGGFPFDQPLQHSHHMHMQGYGLFPNFPAGPPYSLSNTSSLQMSDPYASRPASFMPLYQPNLFTVSHRNSAELNTPILPMSDPYTLASRLSSAMHPYHPHSHTHSIYHRNLSELQRPPHDPRQSFPLVSSQSAANVHPYQP